MGGIKKAILVILSIIVLVLAVVSGYAIKLTNDASRTVNNITESVDRDTSLREEVVNTRNLDPFSVLLLGIDTGDLGRTETGRSDTMMVVTINPKTEQTTIVSLDRDIYTKIVGNNTYDKLNHAYAYGGTKMAIESVQNLLDIPIDHYVSINLKGLKDLITAVGGIEVENAVEFTLDGIHVPAGSITLDGETGLAYARMRYEDPEGDVGRQKRQREVLTKVVAKITSVNTITNYQKILRAVEDNTKTDLTWDQMIDLATNYLSALNTTKSLQLQGEGELINDVYYQILGENNLLAVQNTLKNQLELAASKTLNLTADASQLLFDDATSYSEAESYSE